MTSPSTPDPTQPLPRNAASTIYLVDASADRLSASRQLAVSRLTDQPAEARKALRGIHPDVLELLPQEGKDRIGVSQVRDVIRSAQFSPVQAQNKVCLIPNAEALTLEASNALLKILEEPPRGLQFLLLCEHSADLLPTIVSRSRVLRLPVTSAKETECRLLASGFEPGAAAWLARLPLRAGEVDRLLLSAFDLPEILASMASDVSSRGVIELVDACLGDQPLLRRQALLHLWRRSASWDSDVLTLGVRVLAEQPRDVLMRFFREASAVVFDLVRSESMFSARQDALGEDVRHRLGVSRLRGLCVALDHAHQVLEAYGPVESILVSLLLLPEGEDDGL